MTPEERIIELRTALLRITSQVLQLNAAIDRVSASLRPAADPISSAAASTPVDTTQSEPQRTFQTDVLLYAQRRAARRALRHAIEAGALIPRDDLGFTVEQPSSDEDIDILRLRLAPVESDDESETPTPEAPTSATLPVATATTTTTSDVERAPAPVSARTTRHRTRNNRVSDELLLAREQALVWSVNRRNLRRVRQRQDEARKESENTKEEE